LTVGARIQGQGHGRIDLIGSLTGNIGLKGSLYGKGNISVLNWYFDEHLFDFDWTLFNKPWYPEEETLANIFKW